MSSKPSAKIGELCLLSAVRSAVCAFKIRPLAHMLIQPDFGFFSSEPETYTTPKGTLPLCCRTPATHPSISRFGPPRGLLIQPDFSCVFLRNSGIYHPQGTLCCRTPATHPSISRFGPPRGLLIQPDFSCFFTNPETYTTPKGHCPLCVVVHQPHTPPFPDSGRPGARRATQFWFCKFRLREAPTPACLSDIK